MIIDGKQIADALEKKLEGRLSGKKVCFILFGNDPASKKFIEMKSRVALRLGIFVDVLEVPEPVLTSHAIEVVADAVAKDYDGIVVQLPLPAGVDARKVLDEVPPEMDIDGLSSKTTKTPPVALAVREILQSTKVNLKEKKIVIIGNGKLVGEPVARMFLKNNISYEVIDKDTDSDMKKERLASADVIISGAGVPNLIKPEMVKEGVILIDAGTSESAGKLVGDIDPACIGKASLMTPVPGGVGPVTVVSLFSNLL